MIVLVTVILSNLGLRSWAHCLIQVIPPVNSCWLLAGTHRFSLTWPVNDGIRNEAHLKMEILGWPTQWWKQILAGDLVNNGYYSGHTNDPNYNVVYIYNEENCFGFHLSLLKIKLGPFRFNQVGSMINQRGSAGSSSLK